MNKMVILSFSLLALGCGQNDNGGPQAATSRELSQSGNVRAADEGYFASCNNITDWNTDSDTTVQYESRPQLLDKKIVGMSTEDISGCPGYLLFQHKDGENSKRHIAKADFTDTVKLTDDSGTVKTWCNYDYSRGTDDNGMGKIATIQCVLR
jgi:hypothetical protein